MYFKNYNNEIVHDDTRQKLADFLNQYLTTKVWNETLAEYRQNIIPYVVEERSVRGTVIINHQYIDLPKDDTSYYVFVLPHNSMGGIIINTQEWIALDTFLNTNKLMLRIHGHAGQMFYRNEIYIQTNEHNTELYIAIDKKMFDIINQPFKSELRQVYVAPYYDSDSEGDIKVECGCPKDDEERAKLFEKSKTATTVYINGFEAQPKTIKDILIGDYVELISDDTVLCSFDIDLRDPKQNRQYKSTRDGVLKQIIHVPKNLNPKSHIITHNTCDVYVRPKDIDKEHIRGLFMHRCQYGVEVNQITHNDFAVPVYVFDGYKHHLNCDDITLHVICRKHSNNKTLLRSKYYMDLLYTQKDETILNFLQDTHKPFNAKDLDFWSADNLEQSMYTKMMDGVAKNVTPERVGKYVDALGYHNVMALVSQSIQRKYIDKELSKKMSLIVPILFRDTNVFINMFIDGIKIHNHLITIGDVKEGRVEVTVDNSVPWKEGSELIFELYERMPIHTKVLKPTSDTHTFEIPYSKFNIAQEVDLSIQIKGIDSIYEKSYHEIKDLSEIAEVKIEEDKILIIFKEVAFNNTYVLQNVEAIYKFENEIKDLSKSKDPIVINLITTNDDKPEDKYPIIGNIGALSFLNGLNLVQHVDFEVFEIKDTDGNICARQLVIQNVSYLKEKDNTIETYITRSSMQGIYNGFLTDTVIELPMEDIVLYYPQVSMFSVDGKIIKDVTIKGKEINLNNIDVRNGSLYGTRSLFTTNALEYIDTYHKDDDTKILNILRNYFHTIIRDDKKFIIIPLSHRLYSLYLSIIFRDVTEGKKQIVFDPDIKNLIEQIQEYKYLKNYDIIYTEDLDLNYIDLYPTYQNYISPLIKQYKALRAIAIHELPKDFVFDTKAYYQDIVR